MKKFEPHARVFKLLADAQRVKLLHLLQGGRKSRLEIERLTRAQQTQVNQRLKLLVEGGLVRRITDAQNQARKGELFYELAHPRVSEMLAKAAEVVGDADHAKISDLFSAFGTARRLAFISELHEKPLDTSETTALLKKVGLVRTQLDMLQYRQLVTVKKEGTQPAVRSVASPAVMQLIEMAGKIGGKK